MPCVSLPASTLPTLPSGITFAPTFPAFGGDLALCCKRLPLPTPPVIPPLPPLVFNPVTAAAIQVLFATFRNYHAELPLRCPRE